LSPPKEGADKKIYKYLGLNIRMETLELERIGLTKGESKVYLALLMLGESTAGPIVDEAKITRSKIYDILERLKQKGLVSYITKESTKYFIASNPKSILKYLEEKEKEISTEIERFQKIIPDLENRYNKAIEKGIAEIYLGIKGMQNAFDVLVNEFDSTEVYFAFGASKGENIEEMQKFFDKLHSERKKRKIKSKIIFNLSSKGLFKSQEKSNLVEARYLLESTPASINIYKNYVIIAILSNSPITFLIRNKEVADSFKEYFGVMWKIAKK